MGAATNIVRKIRKVVTYHPASLIAALAAICVISLGIAIYTGGYPPKKRSNVNQPDQLVEVPTDRNAYSETTTPSVNPSKLNITSVDFATTEAEEVTEGRTNEILTDENEGESETVLYDFMESTTITAVTRQDYEDLAV